FIFTNPAFLLTPRCAPVFSQDSKGRFDKALRRKLPADGFRSLTHAIYLLVLLQRSISFPQSYNIQSNCQALLRYFRCSIRSSASIASAEVVASTLMMFCSLPST